MHFIKKLLNTGTSYAHRPIDKRNVLIVNYFSLILFCAFFLLILARLFLLLGPRADSSVLVNSSANIFIADLFVLLPFVFNRFGFLRAARFYTCWLPSILLLLIFITGVSNKEGIILTVAYDNLYVILIGLSVIPYLLLFSVSSKREFFIGLSLPFFTIIFYDRILGLFGLGHASAYKGLPEIGFTIGRLRTMVAYIMLNTCCLSLKLLLERENNKNELLIEELKEKNNLIDQQAQREIENSENKFRLLFEQAGDSITVTNNGLFEQANTSACKLFGYTLDEFTRLKPMDVFDEEDLKKNPIKYDELRNGADVSSERLLKRKDGTVFPAELNSRLWADGRIQTFTRDITERKKAEQQLIQSENLYRILFDQGADAITITVDTPQGRKFEIVNKSACELMGYTLEEFKTMYVNDVFIEEDVINNRVPYDKLKKDGQVTHEIKLRKKNGVIIIVEMNSQLLNDGRIQTFTRDITERRKAEQVIKNSEAQFRILFEQAPDAITITAEAGDHKIFRHANKRACEMFGYTLEEFKTITISDVFAEPDLKDTPQYYVPVVNNENLFTERMLKRKDGSVFPAELNARLLADGSVQTFTRDISERKKAEQLLIESESKFRLLFEQAGDAITVTNENMEFEDANISACEMFGYSSEEFRSLAVNDLQDQNYLRNNPLKLDLINTYKSIFSERMLKRKPATDATLTLNGAATYVYNGYIRDQDNSGTAKKINLVWNGTGTQTLVGPYVYYIGATTINNGTFELYNSSGYASATTINNGATLKISNTANQSIAVAATYVFNNGAMLITNGLTNGNDSLTTSGADAITAGASVTFNNISVTNTTGMGKGIYLDGGLTGGAGATLTINNTNTGNGFVLRNNNSNYSGTLVVNGTASTSSNAGSGIGVGGCTTGLKNADIQINGTMELLNAGIAWKAIASGQFTMGALSGTGVVVANYTGTGEITTLTLGNTNNSGTFSGTIADGTGDVLTIIKTGTATQTLSGNNTYTGGTTINTGTMAAGSLTAFGTGTITVNAGGTLAENGFAITNTIVNNGGTVTP